MQHCLIITLQHCFGMLLCNCELQVQVHSHNTGSANLSFYPAVIVFSMYHFKDIDTKMKNRSVLYFTVTHQGYQMSMIMGKTKPK